MANLRVDKITSTETFETTGSVQFDGPRDGGSIATGYMVVSSSSDFAFGTGDFTVELWVYGINWDASTSNNDQVIYYHNEETSGFFIDGGRISYYNASVGRIVNPGLILENSRWYHLSAVRKDSVLTVYVDGINIGSATDSDDYGASSITIGKNNGNNKNQLLGHISNFRILKGKALYTENFTPPTRELTVTPETVLLACQHKTDASHEKTGKTITVTGNAVANELTPGLLTDVVKSGGNSAITGSVEFDGTGDYLQTTSSDYALGTDDFTVEFWVNYSTGVPGTPVVLDDESTIYAPLIGYPSGSPGNAVLYMSSSGSSWDISSGTSFGPITGNSWIHLALTRKGSTFYLFYNGVLANTISSSASVYQSANTITAGYAQANTYFKGFISNLRVIKGTALYTDNFIPPTRELKKVPGTVLLCCQDSNDPTTEATGKTITGYGDLQKADGVELVTNGHFNANTDNWTAAGSTLSVSSGALRVTKNGTGRAEANQAFTTAAGNIYRVYFDLITDSTAADIRVEVFNDSDSAVLYAPGGNLSVGNKQTFIFTSTSSTSRIELAIASGGSASEFAEFDNVSVTLAETRNGASNFTPQVGNDGSVEFVGPTKINTENYFYLPTGDTVTRDSRSGRGLFGGGDPGINTINYITIASMGNAQDFGDLSQTRLGPGSVASSTRAVFMTGYSGGNVDTMDYVTIATTGNALDFGNLGDDDRHESAGVSNQTRGMIGGGQGSSISDRIDYITIASTGDSIDFGNLTLARRNATGVMSPTRGVFCGGRDNTPAPSTQQEEIDYITIASTGNAIDFGDLTVARGRMGSVCSSIRGVVGGGEGSPADTNVIDYITIASTGNAQDFGDMITASEGDNGGCSNSMRGVFGGHNVPAGLNIMEYVTISSTGNSQDFGDLTYSTTRRTGCSDSHGGLG